MKKALISAVLAAGLVLTGCASDDPGTASPPGTGVIEKPTLPGPGTTQVPVASAEAPTPGTVGPVTPVVPETSESLVAPPATGSVDADTISWFTTVCGELTVIQGASKTLRTLGNSGTPNLGDLITSMGPVAKAFSDASKSIGALNPPSIEGGEAAHHDLVRAFAGLGTMLDIEIMKLAAVDGADDAAIVEAVKSMSQTVQAKMGTDDPLKALSNLSDPGAEVEAAVKAIPACQPFFG